MVKRLFESIALILFALIGVPLLILVLLTVLPVIIIADNRKKRRIRKLILQNDYSYFLIHTTGRWKKQFFEQQIIPQLSSGIEIGVFDGGNFNGFITPDMARHFSLNDQRGFPLVGKIEDGKLFSHSLKAEFLQYVQEEENPERFLEVLQDAIDGL